MVLQDAWEAAPDLPEPEPQLPIELDPPLHSRYRALVKPVFTGARIEELRSTVAAIAAELVDELLGRDDADLIAEYAVPLSVRTLAAFTGLPFEDSPRWVSWITRMFNVRDREDGRRAGAEFGTYIDGLIGVPRTALERGDTTDDFIALLMRSEVDGHRLTDTEIHSFCTVVFGAGFETTADGIGVMLEYLGQNEVAGAQLESHPEIIPSAVEEFVRYATPIQIFGRNTTRDVELHGETIPKGDVVTLSFGSADHDPSVFDQLECCIFERSPNKHVGFGAGVHLCLGAPVARLELSLTLEAFLARVQDHPRHGRGFVEDARRSAWIETSSRQTGGALMRSAVRAAIIADGARSVGTAISEVSSSPRVRASTSAPQATSAGGT